MTDAAPKPNLHTEPLGTADKIADPRARVMLPVSFVQWDRLKARITHLGNPRLDYTNYVMGAWGVSIPCAISFVVYALSSENRPTWALPVYGVVAAVAGVTAKVLSKFQQSEREIRSADATDIVGEMNAIEEAWQREKA
jgi:hypothetical protein